MPEIANSIVNLNQKLNQIESNRALNSNTNTEKQTQTHFAMDSWKTFLLMAIFVQNCCCDSAKQAFTLEPEDHSVVIGSKVLLPCRVEHKTGVLQWTKDDFGLGTHRNLTLSGFERYAMIGTDDDGDYTLQIDPVTLDDDAKYQW